MRALVPLVLATGCAIGAPPGFSSGDTWTLPLVDPLSDGKLVTPVYLEGRGPYLFAIDPDARVTMADRSIVLGGEFRPEPSGRVLDEQDVSHPSYTAQLTNLRVGDLTISLRTVRIGADHAFDSDGRRIYGVLGRDVIADSLVFGFDRDRGVAWLQTQEAFHPPAGAQVLAYGKGTKASPELVVRRLVSTTIGDGAYDLHLDLGEVSSQLRGVHWKEARLRPMEWHKTLIDEVGSHRSVAALGIAEGVRVGDVRGDHLGFAVYDDRRWAYGQLEGTLGLDFFRPYAVAADWHHEKFYLTERNPDVEGLAAIRLARWGALLPSCDGTSCIAVAVTRASSEAPAPDGTFGLAPLQQRPRDAAIATIHRGPAAAGKDLEVVLGATAPSGARLPRLTVHLPASVDTLTAPVEPRYAGATFTVVDTSPFPLECPGGCIGGDAPLAP